MIIELLFLGLSNDSKNKIHSQTQPAEGTTGLLTFSNVHPTLLHYIPNSS